MSWPGLTRPSSLKIQKDGICYAGWPPRRAAMTIRVPFRSARLPRRGPRTHDASLEGDADVPQDRQSPRSKMASRPPTAWARLSFVRNPRSRTARPRTAWQPRGRKAPSSERHAMPAAAVGAVPQNHPVRTHYQRQFAWKPAKRATAGDRTNQSRTSSAASFGCGSTVTLKSHV